jgi:iron complex outermembrane receptor protein
VDETEGVPLREVSLPRALAPERARTASLDVGLTRGAVQLNATVFDNRVATPLRLVDYRPVDGSLALVNAPGAYTARGVELFAVYQGEPLLATVYWTATQARERDALTGTIVDAPLVPRHTGAVDLGFEGDETGTYVALEAFYTGRQALEMDPYRERSPEYVVFGVMARQRIPRGWAFLNLENLGDTRQTRWSPLLPPGGLGSPGGRRTVSAWAPLEGRVINGGVRLTF